jgi:hypothetical protein
MSERKVLNKYYPPDFDASKLPRVKREKNRQFTIRLMAPFNMRCKTCGEYIYRGKKFNARKEDVIGKLYLGIQIYRFYIKCTKCLAEITFLTDPENQDYEMENGAIRNFESIRLAEKQAEAAAKQLKDEEVNNPMKILENRTRDSKREMDVLETLEDLRELNAAHASVDPKILLEEEEKLRQERIDRQMQDELDEDERELKRILGKINKPTVKCDNVLIDDDIFEKKHKLKNESDDDEDEDDKSETILIGTNSKKAKIEEKFAKPSIPVVKLGANAESGNQQLNKLKLSLGIKKKQPLTVEPVKPVDSSNEHNSNNNIKSDTSTILPKASLGLSSLLSAYDNSDSDENSD